MITSIPKTPRSPITHQRSPSRVITQTDECKTPTRETLLALTEDRNRKDIIAFHSAMQKAQIKNTCWFNLAILGNGPVIIEGGAAVNLIVSAISNNPNTPLDLKDLCEAFLSNAINKVNDLDILLEMTLTKKELKQTNPEILAEIKETEKSDSLNPNDTGLGVYPKNKNLNLPPYEFSKLGNTPYTDRYTQSDFLQTVTAAKLLSTYKEYQNDIFSQDKKLKIMNRIAILKKIIDYENHPTPSTLLSYSHLNSSPSNSKIFFNPTTNGSPPRAKRARVVPLPDLSS